MLDINPEDAAKVVALRPCIESLIVRSALSPNSLENRSPRDQQLIDVLKQLCSENTWEGQGPQADQEPGHYSDYQQRRSFAPSDDRLRT